VQEALLVLASKDITVLEIVVPVFYVCLVIFAQLVQSSQHHQMLHVRSELTALLHTFSPTALPEHLAQNKLVSAWLTLVTLAQQVTIALILEWTMTARSFVLLDISAQLDQHSQQLVQLAHSAE